MTQSPRYTLTATSVPMALPATGAAGWLGVAHRPGRWVNLLRPDSTAEEVAQADAWDRDRPLVEWVRGVRFADRLTGIAFEVVPGEGGAPRHYSETAANGSLPDSQPPVSRRWLNERAHDFLTEHPGLAVAPFLERPTWPEEGEAGRQARPDDETLVRRVRRAYRDGPPTPRVALHLEYGVSLNGADDWIKRARRLAEEAGDPLPTPTRGRPRTTTTSTTGRRA